ncbi:LisH domain-containing protein ARMC9 [Schistosoma japonicum]|nr:LisH domain-containing protein ARMC9 [Schistosoma japonicum]
MKTLASNATFARVNAEINAPNCNLSEAPCDIRCSMSDKAINKSQRIASGKFLDYYQLHESSRAFAEESRIYQGVNLDQWMPAPDFIKKQLQKQEVIGLIKANRKEDFYNALYTLVPVSVQQKQEFMQLEFDINLFFLTAFWQDYNNDERHASMNEFKLYLETKGSVHSQNTQFLAYYALPYVTKPNEHPNELSDAEKRAAQYQKRLIRLQLDYQTLISVTADILDALESTLKGKSLDSSILQNIYSRLIHSQHNSSIRINHQNSQLNKTSYCNLRYETKEALLGTKKYETLSQKSTANINFCWYVYVIMFSVTILV